MGLRTLASWTMAMVVLTSALAPRPAMAKPDPRAVAAIATACTPKGAFGETFGAMTLAGAPGPKIGDNRVFTPQVAYPPLDTFAASFTPKSERLAAVTAAARFADKETALDWARAILEATGQNPAQLDFEDARPDLAPGVPMVELQGEVLRLTCQDPALLDAMFDENSLQPRPPHLHEIAPPPADACARPDSSAALLAGFEEAVGHHQENLAEFSMYALRQAYWLTRQSELEPRPEWNDVIGPQARAAQQRAKAAYERFEKAGGGSDACAAALATLAALDEAHKAQRAFLDARVVEIERLARAPHGETVGSSPSL